MKKNLKVFKFGGASLKNVEGIRNVGNILKTYAGQPLVIIVSAMGKTTNALEDVVNAHEKSSGKAPELLNEIKAFHSRLCEELFPRGHEVYAHINDLFVAVEWVLDEEPHENYDYMYDQIVSVGELVSSRIVAAYLNYQWSPNTFLSVKTSFLFSNRSLVWRSEDGGPGTMDAIDPATGSTMT